MSKFDQAIETYVSSLTEKVGRSTIDRELLVAIARSLGPSIYNKDSARVACSDKAELEKIRTSFLMKQLKLKDSPELEKVIKEVCQEMGSSNRNKYRAVFYYLLVEKFEKQNNYIMKKSDQEKEPKGQQENPEEVQFVHDTSSEEIISNYALYAAGFGLIPIPVVDLVSITAVQYNMIKKLSQNYPHVSFSERKTKSVLAAIVGSMGTLELGIMTRILFKSVPFFGPIIGGTAVSGFAYLSTKLIGQIFDDHFASGGDLSIGELTLEKMRDTFNYEIKKTNTAK